MWVGQTDPDGLRQARMDPDGSRRIQTGWTQTDPELDKPGQISFAVLLNLDVLYYQLAALRTEIIWPSFFWHDLFLIFWKKSWDSNPLFMEIGSFFY